MRRSISVILVMLPMTICAQALWTSADAAMSVGKRWGLAADAEYRTTDRFASTERISVGIGAEYKALKPLKFDAAYHYIRRQTEGSLKGHDYFVPAYWTNRHRLHLSAIGKLTFGSFDLSLRERYMYTHSVGTWVEKFAVDGVSQKEDMWISSNNKHVMRSRLKCDLNIPRSRFKPTVSAELFNNLSKGFAGEELRLIAGTSYKINRHNSLMLSYRFIHRPSRLGNTNLNVVALGYSFKK